MLFKIVISIITTILAAELNRLGGKGGFPGARFLYRTLGIGIILTLQAFIFGVKWYWCALILGLNLGLFWFPITLFGDNIRSHPFNIPWLYILGTIEGLKSLPACLPYWWIGVIGAISYGIIFARIQIANIQKEGLAERLYGGARSILNLINIIIK